MNSAKKNTVLPWQVPSDGLHGAGDLLCQHRCGQDWGPHDGLL